MEQNLAKVTEKKKGRGIVWGGGADSARALSLSYTPCLPGRGSFDPGKLFLAANPDPPR